MYLGIFATAEEAALCVARSPEGQAAAKKPAAAAAALTSEEAREYLSLSVPNLLTTLKHQCVQPEKQEQLDQMLQRYMQNELGKEQVRSSSCPVICGCSLRDAFHLVADAASPPLPSLPLYS